MSPARETSAITFGAAAALVAGVFGWLYFAMSPVWVFVPTVAVGAVALALGAAVGERIAASKRIVASALGAGVLLATEGIVVIALFATHTARALMRGDSMPPQVLTDTFVWLFIVVGAFVMILVGAVAGSIARRWAWSVREA